MCIYSYLYSLSIFISKSLEKVLKKETGKLADYLCCGVMEDFYFLAFNFLYFPEIPQ